MYQQHILLIQEKQQILFIINQISFLHQSGVAILMGFLSAIIAFYGFGKQIQFNNDIFFSIILPPIIFSAGYSLRKSLFFENFGIISFLGIFGTVIGFFCLVMTIGFLDNLFFNKLELKQILLLSSVLCATDTVAAMSLIKPQKYPVLNAVLFGEGIINDAVAIILFRTIEQLKVDSEGGFTAEIILKMIFDFLVLFIFSLIIGMVAGFGLSYLLKVNDSFTRSPIKQSSLILLTGYATYLLGEVCGFSGIITLFTCAIIMGHYTFMNISSQSQRGTGLAFQTVSYVAEAFVYAYLGASIFSVSGKWSAVLFSILLVIVFPFVRGLMVYILPFIYKLSRRSFPLKSKQLKICWYSGMVRGVIAFALSLQIQPKRLPVNEQNKLIEAEVREFIETIAVVVVMTTTIFGSSMLKTFMTFIGMNGDHEQINPSNIAIINDNLLSQSEYNRIQMENQPENDKQEQNKSSSFRKRFQEFESNYVVPIFKKPKPEAFNYQMASTSEKKTDEAI